MKSPYKANLVHASCNCNNTHKKMSKFLIVLNQLFQIILLDMATCIQC